MTMVKKHYRKLKTGRVVEIKPHERFRRSIKNSGLSPNTPDYGMRFEQFQNPQFQPESQRLSTFTPSVQSSKLADIAGRIQKKFGIPVQTDMTGIHSDSPVISVEPLEDSNVSFDFKMFQPAGLLDEQYNFKTQAIVWDKATSEETAKTLKAMKTFEKLKKAIEFAKEYI